MHEYAVAEEIVAASLLAIDTQGGERLERVHVIVGDESHIDPEILSEAFTMAATGTAAAEAVLNVETPPDLCTACETDSEVSSTGIAVTAIEVAQ